MIIARTLVHSIAPLLKKKKFLILDQAHSRQNIFPQIYSGAMHSICVRTIFRVFKFFTLKILYRQ